LKANNSRRKGYTFTVVVESKQQPPQGKTQTSDKKQLYIRTSSNSALTTY
jgi:hypothetical protein